MEDSISDEEDQFKSNLRVKSRQKDTQEKDDPKIQDD